jgi:hypothetical protein
LYYFGNHFKAKQGVKQGDIISPTTFNIVINAVIGATETERKIREKQQSSSMLTMALLGAIITYYIAIQQTLKTFVRNFKRFGLMMNVAKTEVMTMLVSKPLNRISNKSYHQ